MHSSLKYCTYLKMIYCSIHSTQLSRYISTSLSLFAFYTTPSSAIFYTIHISRSPTLLFHQHPNIKVHSTFTQAFSPDGAAQVPSKDHSKQAITRSEFQSSLPSPKWMQDPSLSKRSAPSMTRRILPLHSYPPSLPLGHPASWMLYLMWWRVKSIWRTR